MLRTGKVSRFILAFMLILTQFPVASNATFRPVGDVFRPDTITGTLVGLVVDNNRAPMTGVRLIVINQDTGNQRATLTNKEGRYQITFLPLGIYSIEASKEDYVVTQPTRGPIKTALNKVINTAPEIMMGPAATAAAPASAGTGVTTTPPASDRDEIGQLTNIGDATRRANADERQVATLLLAGVRSFDDFALLAPGVAPPPQVKGVAGPGIGAGIGTAGQFSVNGQRARSNNFTVDGSDNNDEDVGVRRQGFVTLVPQSIESIKEFQIVTQLWDAELGRNIGSQVNAVSKSGTSLVHGTLYGFFNHDALNARNFFDYTSDKAQSYPLTVRAGLADGSAQIVPVLLDGVPVVQPNPSGGEDQYRRHQSGVAIGVPISKKYFGPLGSGDPARTFFFGSLERQDIRARQETHFSVPTVAQRGFLGFGATGFTPKDRNGVQRRLYSSDVAGDDVFSLFPFPNNPIGPYGENTFTQVLSADGEGTIFSLKFDHNFTLFGPNRRHTLTGRYNFTNDRHQVPEVGGALFSGIEPRVRTQNLSLFLNSQLTAWLANQVRGSFGRTRLRFNPAPRDPFLRPSRSFPNDPLILNAPIIENFSFPGFRKADLRTSKSGVTADIALGPVGQVVVTPFSPVGLDVYLFPQGRTNNTYQVADTLDLFRGNHTFKFGADLRRTQLNSFLNRNFRPQVVFGGQPDLTRFPRQEPVPLLNLSDSGPIPGFFTGSDLAALGIPTSIFQALSIGTPDSTIGLRFWQSNFFFNDNWRVRRGLTLDYGLRYEYNTVPREANNRIERTFRLDSLPAADPSVRIDSILAIFGKFEFVTYDTTKLISAFDQTLGALKNFLGGRRAIYDPDRNNFGPHLGFAWDPFAGSSTQAGKTVVRGGAGIYYDVTLGSVVSQSRNVFPTFVPVNFDAGTFALAQDLFFIPAPGVGFTRIFNPTFAPVFIFGKDGDLSRLIRPGTLNVIGAPPEALRPLFGFLLHPTTEANQLPSGNGLAFTLPDRRLRSPYALHFNLQVERELSRDYLVNLAYVGSRGVKLTRFRTPNGGPNSIITLENPFGLTVNGETLPPVIPVTPLSLGNPQGTRPNPALGAYTVFDSSASSTYHSLQASLTRRFSRGFQFTAAYTWSHAIDDVSDIFDLAGAYALPQDDSNLRAERGDANFDVRHRFVSSLLSNVPFLGRFNGAHGAGGLLLGGWQMAAISTWQTGQPFTVNSSFDLNFDGNLTDRLPTINGLAVTDSRQQKLALTKPISDFLFDPAGRIGMVGRNTFRANGIAKTDFTLIKNFRVKEGQSLIFRVEAFNVFNRTHFGVPVRILEAPSFGKSTDTVLAPRQIQLALKYVF